ncbi:hypothetical protein OSTOST_13622, partial [Ostertagia ostertagi]
NYADIKRNNDADDWDATFQLLLKDQGLEVMIPDEEDRNFIHQTIFDELCKGILAAETKKRYLAIIDKLVARGAEGVSVIIVNYNVRYFLEVCLDSVLRAAEGLAVEVIVVDNNSGDDSMEMVRTKFPAVIRIANTDNKGFSKANNQGVAIASGEYILFLNPDTVMPEDFFHKTVTYMDANPQAGSVGPRLIDGKGIFAPD